MTKAMALPESLRSTLEKTMSSPGIILGWIGSVCFAACGLPQAAKCIREGHARGLSSLTLLLWLIGEVCCVAAVLINLGWVGWMMFNYLINLACLLVIIRYRIWPSMA